MRGTQVVDGVYRYPFQVFAADISTTVACVASVQVSSLQQQLSDAHTENSELLSKLRDWGVSSHPVAQGAEAKAVSNLEPSVSAAEAAASSSAAVAVDVEAGQRVQVLERELLACNARAEAAEAEARVVVERAARERDKVRSD